MVYICFDSAYKMEWFTKLGTSQYAYHLEEVSPQSLQSLGPSNILPLVNVARSEGPKPELASTTRAGIDAFRAQLPLVDDRPCRPWFVPGKISIIKSLPFPPITSIFHKFQFYFLASQRFGTSTPQGGSRFALQAAGHYGSRGDRAPPNVALRGFRERCSLGLYTSLCLFPSHCFGCT